MAVSGVVAVNLDENNEKTKKKVKGDEMTHLLHVGFLCLLSFSAANHDERDERRPVCEEMVQLHSRRFSINMCLSHNI